MTIEGFDYKGFAENLAGQAAELVPADFSQNDKDYVTNTLLNFATFAGEALYQDQDNLGLNVDQASMITQIIAEWSFHKSVDLIRSGIPQQYWNPILQKILVTIFEIAKQTYKQGLPQDQILQLVEHHVRKVYLDSITELKDKGVIDEGLMEKAAAQSNIDEVMQQMENNGEVSLPETTEQQVNPAVTQNNVPAVQNTTNSVPVKAGESGIAKYVPPKLLKLVTVALLLKRMEDEEQVQEILEDISKELPQATEVNKKKVISRIQNVVDKFGKNRMERKLQLERHKVRQFVFNAVEGEYYEISPRIANIIATYLEGIV